MKVSILQEIFILTQHLHDRQQHIIVKALEKLFCLRSESDPKVPTPKSSIQGP